MPDDTSHQELQMQAPQSPSHLFTDSVSNRALIPPSVKWGSKIVPSVVRESKGAKAGNVFDLFPVAQ